MSNKLDLRGVHVFAKAPKGNHFVLKEVHPVLMLANGEEKLFIQHGRVFDPAGVALSEKNLPGWFNDAIAKLKAPALAEVGYQPRVAVAASTQEKKGS